MKIQNSQGKSMSLEEVANLPVPKAEGDGDTAEEILASLPDNPVCVKCKKKAAEVNADGFCCVCQPPLPLVIEPSAPSVYVPPRPSLEVETEVNRHLKPRILAHVARMKAWDLRKLSVEDRATVSCSLDALAGCFVRVEDALAMLAKAGFVAKTTPVTRIAAKLEFGTKVTLRADQRETFAQIYTDEQIDSLSVVKTTDTHVQLMASDGSNVGLVKLIHVEIKP